MNSTETMWMRPCGYVSGRETYGRSLNESTWFLLLPGSMTTSFHLAEGVRAGSLPIVLFDERGEYAARSETYSRTQPRCKEALSAIRNGLSGAYPSLAALNNRRNHTWLPYVDVGVDWDQIGFVAPAREAASIQHRVQTLSEGEVSKRRMRLARVQPLMTHDGMASYMVFLLAAYHHATPQTFLRAQCAAARASFWPQLNAEAVEITDPYSEAIVAQLQQQYGGAAAPSTASRDPARG